MDSNKKKISEKIISTAAELQSLVHEAEKAGITVEIKDEQRGMRSDGVAIHTISVKLNDRHLMNGARTVIPNQKS